jgi:uncharacterized protein with PQ loop repeat
MNWAGSILLALCAIPQAIKCIREGHAKGIDNTFLVMWASGELLLLAYVIQTGQVALSVNYGCNVLCLAVITKYKITGAK